MATASGSTLAGGTNAPPSVYDTGTVTAKINNVSATVSYSSTSTPQSAAAALASAISNAPSSSVTAGSDGDVNVLVSDSTGTATDYTVTTSSATTNTTYFTAPSFTATAFTMQDGDAADSSGGVGGQIYAYYVPNGGYGPNSNLLASSDSVTGDWLYTYDTLNRLGSSYAVNGPTPYAGQFGCWGYDAFGNRTAEYFQTAACPTPAFAPVTPGTPSSPSTPVSPSVWFAGKTYPIVVKGTGFTTPANATDSCPATQITVSVNTGSVALSDVTVLDSTTITATVAPDATDPAETAEVNLWGPPSGGTPVLDAEPAAAASPMANPASLNSIAPAAGLALVAQTPKPILPVPVITWTYNSQKISKADGSSPQPKTRSLASRSS